jgi:hypothetical protein
VDGNRRHGGPPSSITNENGVARTEWTLGAAIFDLSAPPGGQIVELQSATGGVPAATLGLSIVRIQ